ncbi:hypothetical protein WJX84_011003 [Apatococcus fuscideae]|uniref:Sulfite exporter TauE/SafE n=1 Tax=Apatococcus fuscideae TaxID=2026836 RepID=A0AAW1T3D6_9CHLO
MGSCRSLLVPLCLCALAVAIVGCSPVTHSDKQTVSRLSFVGDDGHDQPDSHTPFEWSTRNIFVAVGVCLCALLANSAGVGGGPLYIPLFNTVLGFDIPHCTALSHTVVSVSAIGSSLYGMLQPSPTHPDRPLLNFDLALTFIPPLLFGVSVGVAFNSFVPEWLQVLLLVFLLSFVIKNIVTKGVTQFRHEQSALEKQAHAKATGRLWRESALNPSDPKGITHDESFHPVEPEGEFVHPDQEPLLDEGERQEAAETGLAPSSSTVQQADTWRSNASIVWKRLPLLQLGEVILLWVIFLAFQLAKVSYVKCSLEWTLVYIGQAIFCLGTSAAFVYYQYFKMLDNPDNVDPELRAILTAGGHHDGHPQGTAGMVRTLLNCAGLMALAGATAGLLGIGGALIFNPYLLSLGVSPQVVASTAVLMILFSSSSIALSLNFIGLLNQHFAVIFAPLAFAFSLLGVLIVGRIIRKTGRTSIIILILAFLIIIGAISTLVFGGLRAEKKLIAGEFGFKPFCSTGR